MNRTFCVFVKIASARRFLQISKTYVFLKNNMGLSMKNTQSADFYADQIDVITNFADIMNVVLKSEFRYKEGSLYLRYILLQSLFTFVTV